MKTRTELFWDIYMDRDKNILEIYDETCAFFSEEIPEEDFEEYDFVEVVLETSGHHEEAALYDKAIKFINLIQKKQPKLYEEVYQYLDDFLIKYYCFTNQNDKASAAFSNFIKTPENDFSHYLMSFKTLLYYGNHEVLDKAISQNYQQVGTSDKLVDDSERDLAFTKLNLTLEKLYKKNPNKLDRKEFKKIAAYGFTDTEEFFNLFEGLFDDNLLLGKNLVTEFIKDRSTFIILLQMKFMRFMHQRDFPFAISGAIWESMIIFWEEQKTKNICAPSDYFPINSNKFQKHLAYFSGLMSDNSMEKIALVWGLPHIFDFLKSLELISNRTFDKVVKLSSRSKAEVIAEYLTDLWHYDFVHNWTKPDTVSAIEFEQEAKIFKKSFSFGQNGSLDLEELIEEELEQIGGLEKLIRAESKKLKKKYNASRKKLTELMNSLQSKQMKAGEGFEMEDEDIQDIEHTPVERELKPVRSDSKIGRNDPCPCGSGKKYKNCCARK